MPRIYQKMSMQEDARALPHDADGRLLRLQKQARAIVFGAQFLRPPSPSNLVYRTSIEKAIEITKQEHAGWLITTQSMPAGDCAGASRASMRISGLYVELDNFEAAIAWCSRARREFRKHSGGNTGDATDASMEFIMKHVECKRRDDFKRAAFCGWASRLVRVRSFTRALCGEEAAEDLRCAFHSWATRALCEPLR
jgi:hypothetical protein